LNQDSRVENDKINVTELISAIFKSSSVIYQRATMLVAVVPVENTRRTLT
jgi:hypothetical protein